MENEIKKVQNAIVNSRMLMTNDSFNSTNLKTELQSAIKTANSSIAVGGKSIRIIKFSNEIIINSIDNIDLKLRSGINKDTPNLTEIISLITSAGQPSKPSTDTENFSAQTITEHKPTEVYNCSTRQNKPRFCNCDNLRDFKASRLDANEYALYCILDLERISTTITNNANDVINFGKAIENCPKGS